MLFRTKDGKLIEMNRTQFHNDTNYYNKIVTIKKPITKVYNQKEDILNICK